MLEDYATIPHSTEDSIQGESPPMHLIKYVDRWTKIKKETTTISMSDKNLEIQKSK